MTQRNIAFFDSGQGGLTVWEEVVKKFPDLNTIYLGDNARIPYGNKGAETITRFTSEASFFLTTHAAEMIVVACGTASSLAVKALARVFKTPLVGIVEPICQEVPKRLSENDQNKSKAVAVLATRASVQSNRFEEELSAIGYEHIWQRACPLFVPLVEEGMTTGSIANEVADLYLKDMPVDVDIVLLACTHFPRMLETIAASIYRHLGRRVSFEDFRGERTICEGREPAIKLIDSSLGIIQRIDEFLQNHPQREEFFSGNTQIYCTDAPEQFARIAKVFTALPLPSPQLVHLGI